MYESYVNPKNLKPSLYKRNISEGGYTKKEKYVFKNDGKTITSTMNKKNMPEKVRTFNINPNSQDVVSLLYKIRTLDFSKMKVGQTQSFTIVFDEKEIPVSIKSMGLETANAGNLGKKECHKISIGAKTQALKGKDKNLIWLTADAKKNSGFNQIQHPGRNRSINPDQRHRPLNHCTMRKTLLILAAFFTILSIIFSALPLGTIAVLPIVVTLLLSFLALRKSDANGKTLPKLLLAVAALCLIVVIGKQLFVKEEVAKDVQFEQTIEKSKEEDKKELEELENLEGDLE